MRSNFLCKKLLVFIITVSMLAMLVTACGPKEDAELSEDAEKSEVEEMIEDAELSKRVADATQIEFILNVLEVTAADPDVPWRVDQEFNVKLSASGTTYMCDCAEAVEYAEQIMPTNTIILMSDWAEGVEIWAKKDDGGRIHFSTSLDKDQIEEVSPSLAKRFAETSVSK